MFESHVEVHSYALQNIFISFNIQNAKRSNYFLIQMANIVNICLHIHIYSYACLHLNEDVLMESDNTFFRVGVWICGKENDSPWTWRVCRRWAPWLKMTGLMTSCFFASWAAAQWNSDTAISNTIRSYASPEGAKEKQLFANSEQQNCGIFIYVYIYIYIIYIYNRRVYIYIYIYIYISHILYIY